MAPSQSRPLVFGPNFCKVSRVKIDGVVVSATNDMGGAENEFMIDETFLASLPSFGQLLSRLEDPGAARRHLRIATKEMKVLGLLTGVPMHI